MADKPILFSGPMVRALLAGTKTQTRRVLNPQPEACNHELWRRPMPDGSQQDNHCDDTFQPSIDDDGLHCRICGNGTHLSRSNKSGVAGIPIRYRIGDRLYVREAWSALYIVRNTPPAQRESIMTPFGPHLREDVWFWADGNPDGGEYEKPRPAMHMPRWASRLTLTVTDVRVERLQDIGTADAIAEGVELAGEGYAAPGMSWLNSPEAAYRCLWQKINGDGSWDENPWVAAYTFTVERGNIDKLPKAA